MNYLTDYLPNDYSMEDLYGGPPDNICPFESRKQYNDWLRKGGDQISWHFFEKHNELTIFRGETGESLKFTIHYYTNFVALYERPDYGNITRDFSTVIEAKKYAENFLRKWKYEQLTGEKMT